MEKWTQQELEALYQEINKRISEDADFRLALKQNAVAAVEKLAGRKLPEGFKLDFVDGEKNHAAAFTLPNFTGDEINLKELNAVPGGSGAPNVGGRKNAETSIPVLGIISVCAVAQDAPPPPFCPDYSVAYPCPGDLSGGCTAEVLDPDRCAVYIAPCPANTAPCSFDLASGCLANAPQGSEAAPCLIDICGAHMCPTQSDPSAADCPIHGCVAMAPPEN